ncbi:DUF5686 family protein [Tenacibaculum piscium]|uniref:DUF5686 family protein n=1 Tax=Tenacibaculum piscium TaxID=1458515 RepID=UPI001F3D4A35|nr:DUF5686 family protein [Tenacibaculum piscium]
MNKKSIVFFLILSINCFNSFAQIIDKEVIADEVLEEVLIASKVNTANIIIKKAIASKKKNTDKFAEYTADFYSRGLFKVKNLPKKFLGKEIDDMGGGLDTTRSGIVYLSETISTIAYQKKPERFKEYILASKVSGTDNGISFNQAKEVNINLYKNAVKFGDALLISPIANNAFNYYHYKLAGTFYDEKGTLISKIKLLPKRKNDPVFSGYIYIVAHSWAIYKIDVTVTGAQISMPIVKSLRLKQEYSQKNDAWMPSSQIIDFKAGIFGFHFNGRFSATYSNYDFKPNFDKQYFSNEILSFDENATQKDSTYWKKNRPVRLTSEEIADYKLKDSLKIIRSSKKYTDSIDKKKNLFKAFNIITGYSHNNTHEKWKLRFSSPIKYLRFNTVQGWNSFIGINFSKDLDEKGQKLSTNTKINYGFADKRITAVANFSYKWNNIDKPILTISGGTTTAQFNDNKPILRLANTGSSIFFKNNYIKIYEKKFAKIAFSQEPVNGIELGSSLEYADRKPLFNNTDYVLFPNKDEIYTSNNPQEPTNFTSSFTPHNMWLFRVSSTVNFGQKYVSYPTKKHNIKTHKYPSLTVGYHKNFGANKARWNSQMMYSEISQKINLNNWGVFKYRIKGGLFFKKKDIPFMDYAHFNGNRLLIAPKKNYVNNFYNLPYYQLSTNDKYAEFHSEYNFKGAILSKIPLLNQLNFHLVGSAKRLLTANQKPYSELAIGLDNIGFGKWRFLRIDFAHAIFNGKRENSIVFGIKL